MGIRTLYRRPIATSLLMLGARIGIRRYGLLPGRRCPRSIPDHCGIGHYPERAGNDGVGRATPSSSSSRHPRWAEMTSTGGIGSTAITSS